LDDYTYLNSYRLNRLFRRDQLIDVILVTNHWRVNPVRYGILTIVSVLVLMGSICSAAELPGIVTTPRGAPARDAVVYLEGAVKSRPLDRAMIDQKGIAFVPHVLVVTKGTTVSFPNDDTVLHNVFAYYDAKRFDLGMYPRGTSKSEKFDKTGVVALLCNIHSNMSAYIVVVDTPYYAVTDRNGKFLISNIDEGDYTLRAWHEPATLAQETITVTGNQSISVSLTRK